MDSHHGATRHGTVLAVSCIAGEERPGDVPLPVARCEQKSAHKTSELHVALVISAGLMPKSKGAASRKPLKRDLQKKVT